MDETGKVTAANVVRPLGMGLDEKAIEAVKQWRFNPATQNGKPVAAQINIPVTFRLLLNCIDDMIRKAAITLLTALMCAALIAQTTDPLPAFEVASVKRTPPPTQDFRMVPGAAGRGPTNDSTYFTRRGTTLKLLIAWAYNVQDYQVTGGPAWIDSDRYDIEARAEHASDRDRMRLMLQSLLAERFGLSVHTESKSRSVYALVVAKDGPKTGPQFRRLTDEEAARSRSRLGGPGQNIFVADLKQFASTLTDIMNPRDFGPSGTQLPQMEFRPVVDQTGLQGIYEITLTWKSGTTTTPEEQAALYEATVEEQLGLKLESKKAMVDTLIVDHANEIPTGN